MADKTLELALRIVAEATGKQNIEQLVQELKNIEQSAESANPATRNLSDLLDELEQRAKSAAPQTEQLSDEIDNVNTSTDKAAPATKKLTDLIDELENTTETAAPNAKKLNDEIDSTTKSTSNAAPKTQQYTENLDNLSDSAQKTNKQIKELEAASKQLTNQVGNIEAQKNAIARYEQLSQSLAENERAYTRAGTSLAELIAKQKAAKQADNDYIAAIKKAETELAALTKKQKEAASDNAQYTVAIQKQQAELNDLKTSQQATAKQVLEYNLNVKEAQTSVNNLSSTIVKNRGEFKQLESTLSATGKDLNNLSAETKELDQQQVAAKIAINNVNQRLEKQRKALAATERSAKGYSSGIKQVTQDLLIMASAYLGLDKVKDSLLGILSAGDKAQAFSAQMAAMMGSIEKGEQATAWIKEFADKTGTRLDSVKQAFASLKTFGIDPMSGALQSLVDYNAKLGGSQEKLEGIILAAGQAWAKQKLQGEEILQMVERGIPVWDLLAKVTGKNTVELQKMSESGQLGRDTMKALFDEMGKQADGQAAKSLERLSGQVALISNKWEAFKIKIADSGVYQVAVDFMTQLNAQFDRLVKDGSIDQAAKKISQFFSTIINDGGESIKTLLDNINSLVTGAERIVGALRIVWNGFTSGIKTIAMAVTEHASSITSAFASVLDFVGADSIAQKAQYQADALKAVSQGFYDSILEDGKNLNDAWQQLTQTTTEQVKTTVTETTEALKQSTDAQQQNITAVAETAGKAVNDLSLMMSKAGIVTSDSLTAIEEQAKQVYETLLEAYKNNEVGVYELEQAYTKWAAAAIDTAAATKQTVPASVEAAAAALGLTEELDKLIAKAKQLKPANDTNSDAVKRFTAEIEATNKAIAQNKEVLKSSTATTEEKAQAQIYLTEQQARLEQQTADLNKVQELEKSNLYDLQREQLNLTQQLEDLNFAYKTGSLDADEYTQKKQRISDILGVVNNLLGDFKNAQDAATTSTRAGTQATKDQASASEQAVSSLAKQQAALERVSEAASNAASKVRQVSISNGASVDTIAQYQIDNGERAYELDTPEIRAAKERIKAKNKKDNQAAMLKRYQSRVNKSKTIKELDKIYKELNWTLGNLNKENRKIIAAAIAARKNQINGVKVSSPSSSYSYTAPTQTYKPSSESYAPSTATADLNSLTAVVRELVTAIKTQQPQATSTTKNTVRLELVLPDKQLIYAEFEERFLQTLEQLSNTQ